MSETKHTPGPWSRNIKPARKYPTIFAGRNKHIAQVLTQGLSDEEVEANCNLIIAAPDMLIALKAFSLLSAMIGKDGRPSWFKDDGAWTEFVIADEYRKAAIAKAGTQ